MRLIELHSDLLDAADCIALSLKVHESLSEEPGYTLELVSPDADLDLDALLASPIGISIDLDGGLVRHFHAHVMAARDTGQLADQYTYTLELGSWLSFLDQRHNFKIFQQLSVPEIVQQIFAAQQRADYRFELSAAYEPWEYCVQYRESDLRFVKRLLEVEGLYFWIEHEADRHVLVVSDTQRFADLPAPYGLMSFLPDGEEQRAVTGREGVQRLQRGRRLRSTTVALRDFDYQVPTKRLDTDAQADQASLQGLNLELYDYADAGLYRDVERGERLARIRLEAIQAQAHLLSGQSNARGLSLGGAFTLIGHPDAQRNRRYFLTGTELSFVQDGPDTSSQGRNVAARFHVLPDDQPFRPLQRTERPSVAGIQSATVVGPAGSEVHTDKLGRIRVHFHWDRYKTTEEDASCWIRVSQAWAGKGWGVLAMPRVGQEVLVTYVDGNVDTPLVTGIVYNGDNPTPYELPKDIRYTGLVSRSLRQGQVQNASQITFDDTRGAERVMLHAERDMQATAERNSSEAVGNDKNVDVKGTSTSVTGVDISYTGVGISFTGVAADFYGVSTTFTGVDLSMTGVSTSFTGTDTSFTGVATSFTGASSSFTGVDTSLTGSATAFTGIDTSFIGAENSFIGTATEMIGVSSSMIGTETSMVGQSWSLVGIDCSATGVATSVIGTSQSAVGSQTSVVGSAINLIGTTNDTIGARTSNIGTTTDSYGTETTTTGVSTSTTGLERSTVGTSISVVGVEISTKGVEISTKETEHKESSVELSRYGIQIKS